MIKRIFRQMLVTQILSAMTVMICMFVDSVMIGRYLGVDAMTAYGLTNPILLIFAAFGSMMTAGIQVVCGRSMGMGDREGTDICFSSSVVLVFSVALAGLVFILIFITPVCTALGAGKPVPDNNVFFLTKDYLTGFIIGAPAFLMAQTLVPYLQMSGKGLRLALAVVFMTVSDIVFDLLNVFVFKGGTLGMGIASSLSYYLAFIIGGSYFLSRECMFRLRLRAVRAKIFGALMKHGIPTMINQVSTVLLVYFTNQVLLSVGHNVSVAAYSVINTIANICYCFGAGIGSVALMLSTMFYSEKDRDALDNIVRTMVSLGLILNFIVTSVTIAAAPFLVRLFLTDNPDALQMAAEGTRLFALSLVFCSMNTSFKNFYQGTGRSGLTNIISAVQSFFSKILFVFVLSRIFGTTGVWYSWIMGEILTLLLVSGNVWREKHRITFSPRDYSLLPDDVMSVKEERIDMTIHSMEEVIEASEKAAQFCEAHGKDARTSMLISLCIEEMASNIVRHGFGKGRKYEESINVRLMFKDGNGLIRLRDNCINFDPVSYMDLHKADDPTSHIGIRMIMKMVRDASYVSSLGLNNLTLVI